jgi:hypothetical protein
MVHIEYSQEDFLSQEQLVISKPSLKNTKEIIMLLSLILMSQLLKSKKIMILLQSDVMESSISYLAKMPSILLGKKSLWRPINLESSK